MLKLAKQLSEVGFQFCLNDELKYAIKKNKNQKPTQQKTQHQTKKVITCQRIGNCWTGFLVKD